MIEGNPEGILPEENVKHGWRVEIWDITKVVITSILIVLPIRYFIVQPFIVRGASMEPNFENGDYLIIDEISYRFNKPQRGDVIVFKYPNNPKQYYIKRIIGLPGEIIAISDEKIIIKNKENPEGFVLKEDYLSGIATNGNVSATLGFDEYYVLGDNRGASSDSRMWGSLKEEFIVGKALLRAFPFDKAEILR